MPYPSRVHADVDRPIPTRSRTRLSIALVALTSLAMLSVETASATPVGACKQRGVLEPAADHEPNTKQVPSRTADGTAQLTTFVSGQRESFVISECRPDGTLHEEEYEAVPDDDGGTSPQWTEIYDVAPNGQFTSVERLLAPPATTERERKDRAAAQTAWRASDDFKRGLAIAKKAPVRKNVPKHRATKPRFGNDPVDPTAAPLADGEGIWFQYFGNKCWHNEGAAGTPRYNKHYAYTTAFGGGWPNTSVGHAAGTWTNIFTSCGFGPNPGLTAYWQGDSPHLAIQNDGVNYVGWGWSGNECGSQALACHYGNGSAWNPVTRRVERTDGDITFDVYKAWTHGAVSGYFDLWSVGAHEFGHAYGLGHATSAYATEQIMFYIGISGSTMARTIGYGDWNALDSMY